MNSTLEAAAQVVVRGKSIVALTGAGISVESGIPPFRGKGGVWERYDPMEYATIDAFLRHPEKVWRVLLLDMIATLEKARPNDGHKGLAALEGMGYLDTVITQNVDGLHQQAGSRDVIEFHGSFAGFHCLRCETPAVIQQLDLGVLPPPCSCGGIFRPDVIMFGEMIPPAHLHRAHQIAESCDVMLVVGTSATVQPAAALPFVAKEAGAAIIEINPTATPLTNMISDIFLKGPAGDVLNRLVAAVEHIR